jgi:hypothetical protein
MSTSEGDGFMTSDSENSEYRRENTGLKKENDRLDPLLDYYMEERFRTVAMCEQRAARERADALATTNSSQSRSATPKQH